MRQSAIVAVLIFLAAIVSRPTEAQTPPTTSAPGEKAQEPTSPKAQKTYHEAIEWLQKGRVSFALDEFKKADKQDDGHCAACQNNIRRFALELHDWKAAQLASEELVSEAQGNTALAIAHYRLGVVLLEKGLEQPKDESFSAAHDEFVKALAASPNFPQAVFADGEALAYLRQDEAAKARFESFAKMVPPGNPDHKRAVRFISEPEMARARMAPPFSVTTMDGRRVSLDDFQGKVVLLDFWATWCEPCREALPHMREIAKKFQGQPFVMLSVSLDNNEQKWKDFVVEHQMTWLQYRDGGAGPISRLFSVNVIPHTFTIDSDGILQQENVGDASIDGKLKKLCARAEEEQAQPQVATK